MEVSFQKGDSKLTIGKNEVEITQGFGRIGIKIPVFSFKTLILKAFATGNSQIYGTFDTKLTISKAEGKYRKLIIKLETEEESLNFSLFHNELIGVIMKLRSLHQELEETLICGEQLTVKRKEEIVEVEDKRISVKADLKDNEKDFLFGTLILRIYGINADGIFGEIALQRNTLKFPFTAFGRKGRMLYPFVTEDAVKLISIL